MIYENYSGNTIEFNGVLYPSLGSATIHFLPTADDEDDEPLLFDDFILPVLPEPRDGIKIIVSPIAFIMDNLVERPDVITFYPVVYSAPEMSDISPPGMPPASYSANGMPGSTPPGMPPASGSANGMPGSTPPGMPPIPPRFPSGPEKI